MSEDNRRPQFGSRDDISWTEKMEKEALEKVMENSSLMPDDAIKYHNENQNIFWDRFYQNHENKFFKDRNWLRTEFKELFSGSHKILEVGCGVGNTVFPILKESGNNTYVYACDVAESGIKILKSNCNFNEKRCHAFVCDITDPKSNLDVPDSSLDIIVLIFVLSAVLPDKLVEKLKPGGLLLFRDYGRLDMVQLRFKNGRSLGENCYARGDGTQVYFFEEGELHNLFNEAGLIKEDCRVDRRLLVNRKRKLHMYRIWIQCKYRKPLIVLQ